MVIYNVRVRYISKKRVEITLLPTWLGRVLGRVVRTGLASRDRDDVGVIHWWWTTTDRHVGMYIERHIEAAPLMTIEEMPIELLLQEGREK